MNTENTVTQERAGKADTVTVSFPVSRATWKRLRNMATDLETSQQAILLEALTGELDRHDKRAESKPKKSVA